MTADVEWLRAERGRFDASDAEFAAALAAVPMLATRWNVSLARGLLGEPHCSFALAGLAHGEAVVMKVPVVGEERTTGYRAARAFADCGGVPVLEGDDATGALLMRKLAGPELASIPDAEATKVWVELLARLHAGTRARGDVLANAMPLARYTALPQTPPEGFDAATHARVAALRAELLESAGPDVLLHGDLHHFNVLADDGSWYAIDPKGLRGDAHFEAAALLRNPFDVLLRAGDLEGLLAARIACVASGLGQSAQRVRRWGIVQTYSCANEGGADWRAAMRRVVAALERIEPEQA